MDYGSLDPIDKLKVVVRIHHDCDQVPIIWGDAGVGKTDFIRKLCEERGGHLVYIDVTQLKGFQDILNALAVQGAGSPEEPHASTTDTWIFFDNLTFALPRSQRAVQSFVDRYRQHGSRHVLRDMGVPDNTKVIVAAVPSGDDSPGLHRPSAKLYNLLAHHELPSTP